MRVVLSARAARDVDRLTDWLIERSPAAARKAAEAMLSGFRTLAEYPYAGRAAEDDVRELVIRFGRDGFIVIYRVDEDAVVLLEVLHGRQER